MNTFRWFVLRRLAHRPGRALLVVAVVAGAVAPLVGVFVEHVSVDAARRRLGSELAGAAPLRLVGATLKGGLTSHDLETARRVTGVQSAQPVVEAVTLFEGSDVPVVVVGMQCAAARSSGIACEPTTWDGPDAPFITSERLSRAHSRVLRTTSGSVLSDPDHSSPALDAVNQGRVVLTGVTRAQRAFERGTRYDSIYISTAPGHDTASVAGGLRNRFDERVRVLDRDSAPPGPDVAGPLSALLGVLALFALIIGWFLSRNITRLSLIEREPEIAVETALGRTRSSVGLELIGEGAICAIAGGLIGAVAGWAVGATLVHALSRLVGDYSGAAPTVTFPVSAVGVSLAAALGLVCGASASSWIAATNTSIVDVGAAQQTTHQVDRPRRWRPVVAGVFAIGLGLAISEIANGPATLAPNGFVLALGGLAITAIGVFTLAGALTGRLVDAAASTAPDESRTKFVLANLSGQTRQLSAVVLSVSFAVTLAAVLGGFEPAIADVSRRITESSIGARYAVNTLAFNDSSLIDAKIGPELVRRIQALPGVVASRDLYVMTRAGHSEIALMAADQPAYANRVIAGRDINEVVAHGEAAIGAPLARELHRGIGDRVTVASPDGPVTIRVGSIVENLNNAGMIMIVKAAVVDRHWGWQPPDPLIVSAPHTNASALTVQLRRLDPHIRAVSGAALANETDRSLGAYFGPVDALRDCLFGVVALAAFTALTLIGLQRRREFALLAAIGVAQTDLQRMAVAEAAFLGAVGAAQGIVIGVVLSEPLRIAAGFTLGIRPGLHIATVGVAVASLVAIAIVIAAATVPARRLRRIDVQAALQTN